LKILYLLKDAEPVRNDLLPSDQSLDREVSVLLLQDGVRLTHVSVDRVYALSDDVHARNITSSYPVVSYADMLRMMFEADTVIAL
jgi:sulfur transfer complex TusBCD TusB component (DsrH family)